MMVEGYRLRLARAAELAQLQAIEQAAARMFRDTPCPELAESEPLPLEALRTGQQAGLVWVVAEAVGDVPVGYLLLKPLDGALHLHELDVLPEHGRRGLGRWLVEHCCTWAAAQGYPLVTLSTFVAVPWNAPLYARWGFAVLPEESLTPGLRAVRATEAAAGFDVMQRVCMGRALETVRPAPGPAARLS